MAPEVDSREDWQATATLERGGGFCQQKAVLLAALLRARGIPAGVVFQDLLDHKIPPHYVAFIGSQRLELHGLTCAFLDGRWVRLDATLPRDFVERKRYRLVEFDGESDAVLAETDIDGEPHFEVLEELGTWPDLPTRSSSSCSASPGCTPTSTSVWPAAGPGNVAMQNSLERLFDGVVTSLRDDVAPAVDDPYARAQVAAAIELLANLAERVEWRSDLLRDEIEQVRAVLETARERPAVLDAPIPADNAGPRRLARRPSRRPRARRRGRPGAARSPLLAARARARPPPHRHVQVTARPRPLHSRSPTSRRRSSRTAGRTACRSSRRRRSASRRCSRSPAWSTSRS